MPSRLRLDASFLIAALLHAAVAFAALRLPRRTAPRAPVISEWLLLEALPPPTVHHPKPRARLAAAAALGAIGEGAVIDLLSRGLLVGP